MDLGNKSVVGISAMNYLFISLVLQVLYLLLTLYGSTIPILYIVEQCFSILK